ncbi:MAG TPA: alpha/beta hydrolase [Mycobacteriales bacterium]|nr:alpha/beta hydrolase [Mycobacteriales bacterium]
MPPGSAMPGPLGVVPPPAGGLDLSLPGDGVRLAATRWPGTGTPVVLLHGLASQRRFWNPVARRLTGPTRDAPAILALDQRGHGDTERPDGPYDVVSVARDLANAMDPLGWSRAVVVGHSWGAAVAATFAAEHPERALSLVVIDGGFSAPPVGFDRAAVRKRLEPPRLAMPPEQLVDMLSGRSPAGEWTDEIAGAVLPIFEVHADGLARARLPFDTHMKVLDGLLDYDATHVLTRVRCPAWLVSCEAFDADDEWTAHKRHALEAITAQLVRPRVLRWAGAVHDVPLQWPDLVAGLIRAAVHDPDIGPARVGGPPA